MVTRSVELSADEVRRLRRKVLHRAHAAIDALGDIAEGKIDPNRKDTMARVAASRVLLSKVLPELSASYAETHHHHHHDVAKLSKAELRQLIGEAIPVKDSIDSTKDLKTIQFSSPDILDLPADLPTDAPTDALVARDAPA
jgi:hypothetical protein